ncbi:hypothetical protein F4677DRAFT_412485 [Hypoxylon crocopeplum]|nr:hypothetical protein F4677DRAFT_412485 [Hypoxylon crocopeplum]
MLERIAKFNHSTRYRPIKPLLHVKPKPTEVRDDGSDRTVFNRRRDVVNQVLSPTTSNFGFDGAGSLLFSTRRSPPLAVRSAEPLADDEYGEMEWNRAALLELSDSVRGNLEREKNGGPDVGKLSKFLEAALRDEEQSGQPALDFGTIEYARLDKLLADLLHFAETIKSILNLSPPPDKLPLQFRIDVLNAKSLRRLWRRRFRERYFMMDQHRCALLVEGGRLKDVSFNSSLSYDLGKWHTKVSGPISELEGNLQFDPGHWWLNITCAERDGIVTTSAETPTRGRYGITVLPLLTGREEMIRSNTYKYIREGRCADMHIPLISQVGREIRVLRGYKLKSILAPQAGVRYDGLFTIRQYGCKLDDKTNIYRLELTLERVADQKKSQDEIKNIPSPSQLDDWNLFEKLEGDKIRLLQGETSYLEWKLRRQAEQIDREEWRRARLFRASFSH